MRVIIYDEEKMNRVKELFGFVTVTGADNFLALGEIVSILNSGKVGEYKKESDGGSDGRMEHETI